MSEEKTDRQLAEETLDKVKSVPMWTFFGMILLVSIWAGSLGRASPDNSAIRSTSYRVNDMQRKIDGMQEQMDRMERMMKEKTK